MRIGKQNMMIEAVCGCHVGKVRSNNEDNLYFNGVILPQDNDGLPKLLQHTQLVEAPVCYAVFDGMGGEAYGETAAYIGASVLKEMFPAIQLSQKSMQHICMQANQTICNEAHVKGDKLMGSTCALLAVEDTTAHIVNLGDSKVFLLRDGTIAQLSVDHTDQAMLESLGIKNRKPRLTQHLGIEQSEMIIEPHYTTAALQENDTFIICSDGLTDMLSNEDIVRIMQYYIELSECTQQLINEALLCGGKDNITVICCKVHF